MREELEVLSAEVAPSHVLSPAETDATASVEALLVRQEMEQILNSEFFRASKRCRAFLSYVVEAVLAGDAGLLKERTLGVELFNRPPSYTTGDDAIVRVKANEIRRRLAQYNATADPRRAVRIELPAGSYVPHFEYALPQQAAAVAEIAVLEENFPGKGAPSSRIQFKWLLTSALLAAILLVGASGLWRSSDPLKEFWSPALSGQSPTIICVGSLDVYLPDRGGTILLPSNNGTRSATEMRRAAEKPEALTLSRMSNAFVGVGDSTAGFLVGRTLQSLGHPSHTDLASRITFSDLKGSPAVLIGAFSNPWTMSLTKSARFAFVETATGSHIIVDRKAQSRFWEIPSLKPTGEATEDYALVTRIWNAETGQGLISIAGITGYGSQAATEFMTNQERLQGLLKQAPQNWERMNVQILFRTDVVNSIPSPARVIATTYW